MDEKAMKVELKRHHKLTLKIIKGHFATNHSHVNQFIDLTALKSRQTESIKVAKILAKEYINTTIVDTIVCMDGCEMIGAFLAEELTNSGLMSINQHQSIYVVTPEVNSNGQMVFRDNIQPMIKDKHVLLLIASASTGKTIAKSTECITYYGGMITGISALFSAVDTIRDYKINSVFTTADLPDYEIYPHNECNMCKSGQKIDAIVNSYGYMKL